MLSKSDIDINQFLPFFAREHVPVAFLVPTETGYEKSIMDATQNVRDLFKEAGIHDYAEQGQGPENKVLIRSFFLLSDRLVDTEASLYRPITKKGDPRIWFRNLKKYCQPCNLLALFVVDGCIYVVNLSDERIRNSLLSENGFAHTILRHALNADSKVYKELLGKLKDLHDQGYVKSISYSDHNVGDTLEYYLGIKANSSKLPDYKGIELKTTRMEPEKSTHKLTLFAQSPDWENSRLKNASQILDEWGYMSESKGVMRRNLNCTISALSPNPQGLYLSVLENRKILMNYGIKDNQTLEVVQWKLDDLKARLKEKHHDTFWINASTEIRSGIEYFRYDAVTYTSKPNVYLLNHLLDNGTITLDYAMHIKPDGKPRDHGYLFRIAKDNFYLLFPDPQYFDLETLDMTKLA